MDDKAWDWKGWQTIKWGTGLFLLVLILFIILAENRKGQGWEKSFFKIPTRAAISK